MAKDDDTEKKSPDADDSKPTKEDKSSKDENSSPPPPPPSSPPPPPPADQDSNKDSSQPPPATDSDQKNNDTPADPTGKKLPKVTPAGNADPNRHKPPATPLPPSKKAGLNSPHSSHNAGVIAGVIVGVGVLLIVLVAVICVCCKKKKKKKKPGQQRPQGGQQRPPSRYYNNVDAQGNNTQQQYNNQNWYNSGQSSSTPHGGWQMPPPPPMMSGDMSGSYSSGPMGSPNPPAPPPHPSLSLGFNKSTFTYDELASATQGFSQANLLGQGGFGFVHKGVLPNGKEVAVKSLKSGSGQGEREFQAEVDIISRVHHRHLVSLVGYCIAGGQRMLVYEFVPNGTLEYHLHGKGRPVMDFETRIKIALGSAKGLAYLHEDCTHRIIHRDIKTANILIDDAFEAKVADFGLAKLSNDTSTHVSTRVMGTFGYLAPEYAASGKLTDKSDVFSYGVMLLELVTGKSPIDPSADEDSLVDWARPQFSRVLDEGRFEGLIDPRLENNFNPQEMTRMVACGAAAIRHSAKRRPKMSQIVRALEGDMSLDALNHEGGMKPGQNTSFNHGSGVSREYDPNSYKQDMKKFMATLEEDYTSSEYSDSNDYGRTGYGMSGDSSMMRGARK